jgi:hypothetical protein
VKNILVLSKKRKTNCTHLKSSILKKWSQINFYTLMRNIFDNNYNCCIVNITDITNINPNKIIDINEILITDDLTIIITFF